MSSRPLRQVRRFTRNSYSFKPLFFCRFLRFGMTFRSKSPVPRMRLAHSPTARACWPSTAAATVCFISQSHSSIATSHSASPAVFHDNNTANRIFRVPIFTAFRSKDGSLHVTAGAVLLGTRRSVYFPNDLPLLAPPLRESRPVLPIYADHLRFY